MSRITTRVMGTFVRATVVSRSPYLTYVAPEYANTGLLNEKSDVYNFSVLLLEAVTGKDPIDYGRPANGKLSDFLAWPSCWVQGRAISLLELWELSGPEYGNTGRPANKVHLVEWLKMMVGTKGA